MPAFELIYFEGCPNIERFRQNLVSVGISFAEVRQDHLPVNHPHRGYTSPTLLKGDEVVFGHATESGQGGCSLDIPTVEQLQKRLKVDVLKNQTAGKSRLLPLGSIGSALTVGLCPICIPAIGAFLASMGLGFLVTETVLKPLLIVFLLVTVAGLLWSFVKEHRRLGPLTLGILMAVGLYVGRYVYVGITLNKLLMYGGIVGILAATVWNLRLRKSLGCKSCENISDPIPSREVHS